MKRYDDVVEKLVKLEAKAATRGGKKLIETQTKIGQLQKQRETLEAGLRQAANNAKSHRLAVIADRAGEVVPMAGEVLATGRHIAAAVAGKYASARAIIAEVREAAEPVIGAATAADAMTSGAEKAASVMGSGVPSLSSLGARGLPEISRSLTEEVEVLHLEMDAMNVSIAFLRKNHSDFVTRLENHGASAEQIKEAYKVVGSDINKLVDASGRLKKAIVVEGDNAKAARRLGIGTEFIECGMQVATAATVGILAAAGPAITAGMHAAAELGTMKDAVAELEDGSEEETIRVTFDHAVDSMLEAAEKAASMMGNRSSPAPTGPSADSVSGTPPDLGRVHTPRSAEILRLGDRVVEAEEDIDSLEEEQDKFEKLLVEAEFDADQIKMLAEVTEGQLHELFDEQGKIRKAIGILDKNGKLHRVLHIVGKAIHIIPIAGRACTGLSRLVMEGVGTYSDASKAFEDPKVMLAEGRTVLRLVEGGGGSSTAPKTPKTGRSCCFTKA